MIITKSEPFTREEIEKLKRDQKIIIESLAMDLKRIAIGLHRGSLKMANRFKDEALKREHVNRVSHPMCDFCGQKMH